MENLQYKAHQRVDINVILARQLLSLRRTTPLSGLVIYNNGEWHPEVTSRAWLEDFMNEQKLTKAILYDTVMPHSIEFKNPKAWFYLSESISKNSFQNITHNRSYKRKNINYFDVVGSLDKTGSMILEQGTMLLCT